jgi:hypothetical protein
MLSLLGWNGQLLLSDPLYNPYQIISILGTSNYEIHSISSHFHSGIFRGCSNLAHLWCSAFTLWHVSHWATYSVTSRFIPYHQSSLRINSLMCFRLGTHIHLSNHMVPWLSSEKSLVLLSQINCHISFNFASFNWPSRISASRVGSTSIVTVASFTIPRLRYSISLHSFGRILLAKVVLQYFLWLSASTTTLAFAGW